ncbi:MAG: YjzC family protein [Eubacteriaceae bacterium]|nr:YjzC family protein [Eubacteriaceae bacterium]
MSTRLYRSGETNTPKGFYIEVSGNGTNVYNPRVAEVEGEEPLPLTSTNENRWMFRSHIT